MLWKNNNFLSAFVINTAHRRNIWQNCISISFRAEIVITRESLYIMNMLEKSSLSWNIWANLSAKLPRSFWLRPITRSIRVLLLWRWKPMLANRRWIVSVAAWTHAVFLILNFIWHKVWRMALPMLIATSMKMTALNHTRGKYLSPQWQRSIMSVIHWINLPSTAPSTCSLRQKNRLFRIRFFSRRCPRCDE